MTELRIEHVQELLDVGDFQGEVEPVLARLCLDLDEQLQREREGREKLDAALKTLHETLKYEESHAGVLVQSETMRHRHKGVAVQHLIERLRDALQSAPQAQAGEA